MSITDGLRKWVRDRAYVTNDPGLAERVDELCYSIDEEHEREVREEHTKGYNEGFDEGFASADDWDVDHAEELAEHGWMELPRDVDGKVIHIGDVIAHVPDSINELTLETVTRIVFVKDGYRIETEEHSYPVPKFLRHVERPTVEGTLRDLVREVSPDAEWEDELFTEYADRIQEVLRDE